MEIWKGVMECKLHSHITQRKGSSLDFLRHKMTPWKVLSCMRRRCSGISDHPWQISKVLVITFYKTCILQEKNLQYSSASWVPKLKVACVDIIHSKYSFLLIFMKAANPSEVGCALMRLVNLRWDRLFQDYLGYSEILILCRCEGHWGHSVWRSSIP